MGNINITKLKIGTILFCGDPNREEDLYKVTRIDLGRDRIDVIHIKSGDKCPNNSTGTFSGIKRIDNWRKVIENEI